MNPQDKDLMTFQLDGLCDAHRSPSNSTSKVNVALGGITLPAPRAPYASCGGMVSLRLPPTFIPATPSSQPLMTCPAPTRKEKGSLRSIELSNLVPLASQPV